jgi:glycine/D-amino acid oxidase-like deaminating enzyme/nitrite reductase/ring-hydroxylating ferredoxin subunit
MEDGLGKFASLWLETAERRERPRLSENLRADVAVLGAGTVGLTAAVALAEEGADVVLVEGRRIGAGATGYTTAKLSSLHGLTYAELLAKHGEGLARLYGQANEAGIGRVAKVVARHRIACELRIKPNVTYTESPDEVAQVAEEADAAERLGLPASYADHLDLPYPIAAAVWFADQAEFHPVKYLEGLAGAFEGAGGRLFERSMAVSVDEGSPCTVRTRDGAAVTADHVIVATHVPFLDRGLFFARQHPERSYVVASRIDGDAPTGMYLSTESPAHSIRVHRLADGRRWLLVGGESHKTGQADAGERYRRLRDWSAERFDAGPVEYHWATHDHVPVDKVPFVGPLHPFTERVLIATGFRKWGLAMGATAADQLVDQVQGRESPWVELFDTSRLRPRASLGSFVKENANVGFHFFADRLKRGSAEDLKPGEGRLVGAGLGQRAVYRDDDGRLHSLSARCTHLGCMVAWNGAERTWDCTCHGSRFAADGGVIEGPAVRPLEARGD